MTEQLRDREDKEKFLLLVHLVSQKKSRMNKRKAIFVDLMVNERIIIFQS